MTHPMVHHVFLQNYPRVKNIKKNIQEGVQSDLLRPLSDNIALKDVAKNTSKRNYVAHNDLALSCGVSNEVSMFKKARPMQHKFKHR